MNTRRDNGRRGRVRSCAGVCLAELMIALAAGAIVLSAAVQSLSHFERRLSVQQEAVAHGQDLRIGLMVMVEELRRVMASPAGILLTTMDRHEVVFFSNLDGITAGLTEAVSPGQQELRVTSGAGWSKGKRAMLCDQEQCLETRLARDGQKSLLYLTAPLERGFPQGTTVWLVSQVRYYLGKDQFGHDTLMRQIEGGTTPLIANLADIEFRYLDKDGRPAEDSARARRIRMEITGNDGQRTAREVALRQ